MPSGISPCSSKCFSAAGSPTHMICAFAGLPGGKWRRSTLVCWADAGVMLKMPPTVAAVIRIPAVISDAVSSNAGVFAAAFLFICMLLMLQ